MKSSGPKTLLGLALVTITLNLLYDYLVKPVAPWLATSIFRVITLGSSRLADAAYAQAATDPTSEGQITFSAMFISAMIVATGNLLWPERLRSKWFKKMHDAQNWADHTSEKLATGAIPDEDLKAIEIKLRAVQASMRRTKRLTGLLLLIGTITFSFQSLVTSVSTLVWRKFHRDLAIIAPYATQNECQLFTSRFALMKTKKEFVGLVSDMTAIGAKQGITLPEHI